MMMMMMISNLLNKLCRMQLGSSALPVKRFSFHFQFTNTACSHAMDLI